MNEDEEMGSLEWDVYFDRKYITRTIEETETNLVSPMKDSCAEGIEDSKTPEGEEE